MGDDSEPETTTGPWPEKGRLATRLEGRLMVREQIRDAKKLLEWPTPKTCGVASLQALKLNRFIIGDVIAVWAETCRQPKSPPIGWLRQEALINPSPVP